MVFMIKVTSPATYRTTAQMKNFCLCYATLKFLPFEDCKELFADGKWGFLTDPAAKETTPVASKVYLAKKRQPTCIYSKFR